MKKVVCVLLCVSLLAASLFANAAVVGEDAIWSLNALYATDLDNYSVTINGVTIPLSSYQVGDEFPADKYVSKYGYGSGYECHGFALYAYDEIFEDQGEVIAMSRNIGSVAATKEFISNIWPGTLIQSTRPHSMIFLGTDSTGVIVYHANWSGPNEVSVSHFTWSQFASSFSTIKKVIMPHNVEEWTSNSTSHSGDCNVCGRTHTGRHMASIAGMGTCLVCGYYGNMSGIQSVGNSTH